MTWRDLAFSHFGTQKITLELSSTNSGESHSVKSVELHCQGWSVQIWNSKLSTNSWVAYEWYFLWGKLQWKGEDAQVEAGLGYFRTEVRVEHRFYLVDRLKFLMLANTKSQREAKLWTLLSAKNDHPHWKRSRNEISYSSKVSSLFTWGDHFFYSDARSFLFLIPGPHHEEESG